MKTDIDEFGNVVCRYCRNHVYFVLGEEEQHKNCKAAYGEWE